MSRASVASLVGDVALYGIPRVAFMALSVVLVPLYTRYFSVAEYGLIENLNILGVIVSWLFGLALPDAVTRFYSVAESAADRARILSSAAVGAAVSGVLGLAAVVVLAGWLGPMLLHEAPAHSRLLMLLVTSSVVLNFVLSVGQSALLASFRRRDYMITTLGSVLITAAVAITCLVVLDLGVYSLFLGAIAGYGSVMVYAFARLRGELGRPDLTVLRGLLAYSIPFVPAALAMVAIRSADRYFITVLMPDPLYHVGLYSTAEKVMGPLVLLSAGFQIAWAPFAMAASRQEDVRALYVGAFKLYVAVMSASVVILSAAAPWLLQVLTTPSYYPSVVYAPPLGLYLALSSLYYIGSMGLVLTNRTRLLVPMVVAAALLNAGLNLLWIPRWGVTGAAWATVVAMLAYNAMIYVTSERLRPFGYPLRTALLVYAVAGVAAHVALEGPAVAALALALHVGVLVGTGFVDVRAMRSRPAALFQLVRRGFRA